MTKYQEYFNKMISENKAEFDKFRKLHDQYAMDQDNLQETFNTEGKKIQTIIREYENRLCKNSEKTYSMFTTKLSEKFWSLIRAEFPMIDYIGIIAKKESIFSLKKINLH